MTASKLGRSDRGVQQPRPLGEKTRDEPRQTQRQPLRKQDIRTIRSRKIKIQRFTYEIHSTPKTRDPSGVITPSTNIYNIYILVYVSMHSLIFYSYSLVCSSPTIQLSSQQSYFGFGVGWVLGWFVEWVDKINYYWFSRPRRRYSKPLPNGYRLK